MKTIISRSFFLLFTIAILGQAKAINPPALAVDNSSMLAKMERNLEHALNRNIAFPLLAKENMTGEVYVSFVIDKEGKVEVLSCRSDNDALSEYVLRKLARIDIGENPDGIWKTTHMRFNFRPENG